jgi:4-amino-4-deoxy-L-arabinose transferase-like glycosyltransferase
MDKVNAPRIGLPRGGQSASGCPPLGADAIGTALQAPSAWRLVLLAHIAVCTVFATWTLGWGSVHSDMMEAWAWGKEFQLGYVKHPPAFAWIAGAWFAVMPRAGWSFYLLSALNGAVGLAGVWMIAGRLLDPCQRWVAWLLLMLTPFFSIYAARYNANSALLASWPWVVYFFIRSIETRTFVHGLAFGVLAALALLTKYFSCVLLMSCLLAALLHPDRDRYFRSSAPYVAVIACAVLMLPHAVWIVQAEFPTFKYALSKTEYPVYGVRLRTLGAVVTSLANLALAAAVLVFICWGRVEQVARTVVRAMRAPGMAWLSTLTFGPIVLTLLISLVGNVRISATFFIPAFFMLPVFLVRATAANMPPRIVGTLARCVVAVWTLLLVVAPVSGYAAARYGWGPAVQPYRELALAATKAWHETFGRRLELVASDDALAHALTFYSPDAPSFLSLAHPASTPWISGRHLKASGLLIVCRAEDRHCLDAATSFDRPENRQIVTAVPVHFWGYTGPARKFVMIMVPPSAD